MRPEGGGQWTLSEPWWTRLLTATFTSEQAKKFLRWGALGDVLLVSKGDPGTRRAGARLAPTDSAAPGAVKPPQLSAVALEGKRAFDATCAACHGVNASGTDKGPPLVHVFYNPGHHDDASFYRAVKNGVPQHHWRFGNMPPQPNVQDAELANIIRYVRELQRANGIFYQPHTM